MKIYLLALCGAGVAVVLVLVISSLVKQDWSQFAPDVVSGTVVGGFFSTIAAVLLIQRESGMERASRASETKAVWAVARETLRIAIGGDWNDEQDRSDNWDWEWRQVADVANLTIASDLSRWAQVNEDEPEIPVALDLVTKSGRIRQDALNLDQAIQRRIVTLVPGSARANDIQRACWSLLRGRGLSEADSDPELWATRTLSTPDIADQSSKYAESVKSLRRTRDALWKMIK